MAYGFHHGGLCRCGGLFILSLGGLSGQESAKRAVWYGIVGMALAVAATLYGRRRQLACRWMIAVLIAVGSGPSAGSWRSACR